jgi:sigma-E factor negative regulatory protein RseC
MMLEQHARVVRVAEDGVWVEAVEPSGCGTCGGNGCSTRQIAEIFQRRPRHFRVASELPLAAGERVVVGIAHGGVLRAAFQAYGVPVLLVFAGALAGNAWQPGDFAAALGAVCGGLVAWGVARASGRRHARAMQPIVLRREDFFLRRES